MTATVDYLPVAAAGGSNVESQGSFAGSGHQLTGFVSGIALSAQLNKVWRQSSVMSAAIANLIAEVTGQNVLDDGNVTALIGLLAIALNGVAYCGTSGGAANVQTLTPTIPVPVLVAGQEYAFLAGMTNTAATTLNISGLGAIAIQANGLSGPAALIGGEIVTGNLVTVTYNGTVFLMNGFKGSATTIQKKGSNLGDYTTASGAYVNVDGTNLAATITIPIGWKLLIQVSGNYVINTGGASASFCIADGGTPLQQLDIGVSAGGSPCTQVFAMNYEITGDGGSHAISLQYFTAGGSASNVIIRNSSGYFPVMTMFLTPSN